MSVPRTVEELLVRAAITDALYRSVVCFDRPDDTLFNSAYTEDAVFEIGEEVTRGRQAIHDTLYGFVSKLDTTHFVTNIRIDHEEGASTATATASALAQHFRQDHVQKQDNANFLGGSLYDMEFVKEGSDWKVKYFKLKVVWSQGDFSVVRP